MTYILSQIIGAIAYSTISFSFFKKKKREILFIQIISYILFTIHYFMLGGTTGAICNILGLIAFILIYYFDKHKKILIAILIPIIVIIAMLTYESGFSILPIFASVISIVAFLTDSENIIRFIGIISAICWTIYAVVYKSYVALFFETALIISTIIAFKKNYKKEPKSKI